jgi:hypothetical protein
MKLSRYVVGKCRKMKTFSYYVSIESQVVVEIRGVSERERE